jgi:hypothetical protein
VPDSRDATSNEAGNTNEAYWSIEKALNELWASTRAAHPLTGEYRCGVRECVRRNIVIIECAISCSTT